MSPRNKMFGGLARNPAAAAAGGPQAMEIHPAVAPEAGDIIVTKRRVSVQKLLTEKIFPAQATVTTTAWPSSR